MSANLYETDFYAWANQQATLLREGRLSAADIENIAEEIESMGKREKRELVSRLTVLLMHLLKWERQPDRRGSSWRATIRVQRIALSRHLDDNPSLRAQMTDSIENAYEVARIDAAVETHLPEADFPAECPWPFEAIMDDGFWPE